jgi:hypothetical protein
LVFGINKPLSCLYRHGPQRSSFYGEEPARITLQLRGLFIPNTKYTMPSWLGTAHLPEESAGLIGEVGMRNGKC